MKYKDYISRIVSLLLLLLAGWATAAAQTEVTVDFDPNSNLTGTLDGNNFDPLETFHIDEFGITFSFSKGTASTNPRYWANNNHLRLYNGNTFIVESSDIPLQIIAFNLDDTKYNPTLTCDTGKVTYDAEINAYIWENTDSQSKASFSVADDQFRVLNITLTIDETFTVKPKAPVFSQNSSEFYSDFELTITDLNEPAAKIYYTTDGSDPSETNGTLYSNPITIPAGNNVTVKAVAINDNGASTITSATYTYVASYKLTFATNTISAIYGLDFYRSNNDMYRAGQQLSGYIYLNQGYKDFTVTLNGTPLTATSYTWSTNSYAYKISFNMPEQDSMLVFDAKFDPESPSEPEGSEPVIPVKKYNLQLVSSPVSACSTFYGNGSYAADTNVGVEAYANSGYVFIGWEKDGKTISTDQYFRYTMPTSDVVLTAKFVYNPTNPKDPQQPDLKYPLTAISSPSGACTFRYSSNEVAIGSSYTVYAYPQKGYKFKGWLVNGEPKYFDSDYSDIYSAYYSDTMVEGGVALVAVLEYNPDSPGNPGANNFNPTTGQLVIDDFTTGKLSNAIDNALGSHNSNEVNSIIVKGIMDSYDYDALRSINASTIDLSRVGGETEISHGCFSNSVATNIMLPNCISEFGDYVFDSCSNLSSLTIHATTPPTCSQNTFSDFINKDNLIVYVPAFAVTLYEKADYWSDFTILPISDNIHVLQVNLPTEASDGRYKHNSIEIVNQSSGIRQKYVISDRILYTFNGLQKDEQYNVYMYSQSGLEIGRIENVVIPDGDIEVSFDNLKELYNVNAKVIANGSDVTSQVTVEWYKPLADGTTTYLRKATSLGEIPDGQELICHVSLDSKLGVAYSNPEDVKFTVSADDNICEITLSPIRTILLSGRVVDGDDLALSGATISASQTINGKYIKNYSTKSGSDGNWSLSLLDAPETRLTFSANECVNLNDTISAFASDIDALNIGKKTLKSIVGARITYDFTYLEAGAEKAESNYANSDNIAISVYNVTQERAHNELSLQYPILAVLDENINAGDELRLTATSKNNQFNPIVKTVTVGENQRGNVTFDIIGKGGISASFESTENPTVVAMLYNENGELVKKATYSEAKASFTNLEDGNYSLISMGQSDLMSSILRLSSFGDVGLSEGKDYVKSSVCVETGKIAKVIISEIPAFDESLFYYTNSSTNFSVNKSSITSGNYLTLRANIDFKNVYKNNISDVTLVVDLPKTCEFVEQSVIQGTSPISYTFDNNRLTIQLGNNYLNQIRFCAMPIVGGTFNASASIIFKHNGKYITQPIGSAISEVKDFEIIVPSTITSPFVPIKGSGLNRSIVKVYANDELIGETVVQKNGTWSADCQLSEAHNLKKYSIYAKIITPNGSTLQTESKTAVYDKNSIEAKTVTMTFFNGWLSQNINVVFDFTSKTTSCSSYMFYTTTNISFIADLTENSPEVVSSVDLYVFTDKNEKRLIKLAYDKASDKWIGVSEFPSNNLPVNIAISINGTTPVQHDSSLMARLSGIWKEGRDAAENILNSIEDEEKYAAEQAIEIDAQSENSKKTLEALLRGLESGLDNESINEYLSKLGIDSPETTPEIPENADLDWLNSILAEGDKLLSETIKPSDDYKSLIDKSNKVLADDKGINEKESFKSILEDKIEVVSESGEQVTIYQTLPSLLSKDLTEGCDTTALHMTEGPDALFLTNDEKGITILIDNNSDNATVIISKSVASDVNAILLKAKKQNNFVEAMKEAATDAEQLVSSITSFFSEIATQANDKVNELKSSIKELENARADIFGQRAGVNMKVHDTERQLRILRSQQVVDLNEYQRLKNQIDDLTSRRADLLSDYNRLCNAGNELTNQMNKMRPLLTGALAFVAQVNEVFELVSGIKSFISHSSTAIQDFNRWQSLINAIEPCEGDEADARNLKNDCESDWSDLAWSKGYYPSIALTGVATTINGVLFVKKDLKWLVGFVSGILTNIINGTADVMFDNTVNYSAQWYPKRYAEYLALECKNQKDTKPTPPIKNWPRVDDGNKDRVEIVQYGEFEPINPIHDPSGYVYEAVPSNRVEGVQASIYYKETVEDMYGDLHDEIVLWDAEEYAQKNPLFTDKNGMYQWDVPQGLWQVKFEKDGYQTAYSEWLPVPPPQLEVNIPICQNKQPEVTEARAYEEGIEILFDKFMQPASLTPDNIFVTANGLKLNGSIELLNEELASEFADESDPGAARFASRVRFVPEQSLSATTGEIRLTVSRNVLSYAGIPMTETYTQVLDVEKEVQTIYADDVKVLYGGSKEISIFALPSEAAAGRTLHITNSSDLIMSLSSNEVTLDEEGKAIITVTGSLPGSAQLSFAIDDVTATGECTVDVMTEIINAEAPKSSRASGTAVYRGTKIELSTDTKNATIYFTTDGSCPCDEDGTRRKYTVPIIINEDTQILAITSVGNGADDSSETVEFNYTLKRSDLDYNMAEGWTWISHNFDDTISPATLAADENVYRILSQTQEVIRDSIYGIVGTLRELSASEGYKVESTAATSLPRISDVAWNPATPISISSGWNWLGYPVGQTMSVDEAFASTTAETGDVIVGQNGFAQFDGENWVGTLSTMSPGMGYMYNSQSAKNVVYNTSIVSNAGALNVSGITNNKGLALDIHKYGVIMPVIATISDYNGANLDNADFQVAAFCGSECRGIGRLVNGLLMMNVYGNVNDNISFQVTDSDGEISYSNNAAIKFSETIIGDIFEPYVITINKGSGVEGVSYDGNIKVTVEGDMLRISGADCNDIQLVEIYDIRGQKQLRTSHVDNSGIRISNLTDGVYVIIVKANGEYSYHKINIS